MNTETAAEQPPVSSAPANVLQQERSGHAFMRGVLLLGSLLAMHIWLM